MGGLRRLLFVGWCMGWLLVAWLSLTPAPEALPISDKLQHLLGYGLVTLSVGAFADRPSRIHLLALIAFTMSGFMELGQLFVPGRLAEWGDMAANGIGVGLGWLGALALLQLRRTAIRLFSRKPA